MVSAENGMVRARLGAHRLTRAPAPSQMSLTRTYGIGKHLARTVCAQMGLNTRTKCRDIPMPTLRAVAYKVEKEYTVMQELMEEQKNDIMYLFNMRCYRGIRHSQNLPVRGQRTCTNGKTAKKIQRRRAAFLSLNFPKEKKKKYFKKK